MTTSPSEIPAETKKVFIASLLTCSFMACERLWGRLGGGYGLDKQNTDPPPLQLTPHKRLPHKYTPQTI